MAKKQKKDRLEKLAAHDFEPMPGKFDADGFNQRMEADSRHAYLAVASLHQTKEELVRAFRKEPAAIAALADATRDTADGLRELADMLETAHARMLCACAASLAV